MSKTRKVIKLNSKPRQRSKKHDGKISSAQREALLREKAASREKTQVQIKSVPIGTKVAEPVRNNPAPKPIKKGLFGKLFSKKETNQETKVPVTPVVEPEPVVEEPKAEVAEEPTPIIEEPKVEVVEEPTPIIVEPKAEVVEETPEPVTEEVKVEEPIAETVETEPVEPIVEELPVAEPEETVEPIFEEEPKVEEAPVAEETVEEAPVIVEYTEEEKKEKKEVIIRLKKMSKAELMRFIKTTAKGTDDAIIQMRDEQKILDEKLAQIKSLKTPKDADENLRKELNAQRAAIRKERDACVKKLALLKSKAEALERANDQYSEVASNLLGQNMNFRKQERLCPIDPRLEKNIKELTEMVARGLN